VKGLASLLADPGPLLRQLSVSVPEPLALQRASRQLDGEGGSTAANLDVAELQVMVSRAVREARLGSLSRRDLREVCRVFLHPPHAPASDREIGLPILAEVERLQRRAAMLALIDAYLDRFQPESPDVEAFGAQLDRMCATWPWRQEDEWRRRARLYSLFDAKKAPLRLARAVLDSEKAPPEILKEIGLQTEGRMRGGLAEAAFKEGCAHVLGRKGAGLPPAQLRLIDWGRLGGQTYAYPRAWKEFAEALFKPWSAAEPKSEHKTAIIEAAVSYAGDPRVQPARWAPVRDAAPDAYEVIVRWLTKASVKQFFDIVAQTTDRPDMWAQRRKFWEAYLDGDCISAAWVAFGADGAWRAEQAARQNSDSGLSMFGRLASGGGRTSEHAALIMKIGDLTVVEWSHNGRWNVWKHGEKRHPTLFKQNTRQRPDYEPHELMNAPTSGPHLGDWQWKVREIIRHETGLTP